MTDVKNMVLPWNHIQKHGIAIVQLKKHGINAWCNLKDVIVMIYVRTWYWHGATPKNMVLLLYKLISYQQFRKKKSSS